MAEKQFFVNGDVVRDIRSGATALVLSFEPWLEDVLVRVYDNGSYNHQLVPASELRYY